MTAPTAAAILEQLSEKDAQVLNLLALCRTPEFVQVWRAGSGPAPSLRPPPAQAGPSRRSPSKSRPAAWSERLYPDDHELLYCRALALVNCGNPTRAEVFVREFLDRTDLPPAIRSDALSLAGRIRKDLAVRTTDLAVRSRRLREAFGFYEQAFELSGDTFPGINAASLALLVGEPDRSRAIAARVRDGVLAELDQPGRDRDYWLLATLGEAYLLLGDETAAKGRYAEAVRLAREEAG